jgi:hypothetical protein
MAQDFAPLFRSIWSDPDWRSLTVDAQHLYKLLMSHPDRNAAGVLPLLIRKWTRLARDLSVDRIEGALTELEQRNFVVVDDETDEVLVRSFIRRTKVYTHIRLLTNALREVSEVESLRIRTAACQELARLPRLAVPENPKMKAEAEAAQRRLDELVADWAPQGETPGPRGVHPMADGMADPLAHPPVVGTGAVAGTGAGAHHPPKPAKSQGGSHVSSGSGSAPPRFPDHCTRHADVPIPGKCGDCKDTREANRYAAEQLPDYRLMVVPPLCGECDERWIETPSGLAKCPRCYPQERAS